MSPFFNIHLLVLFHYICEHKVNDIDGSKYVVVWNTDP